ncbi:MAG: glycosyltransferase [Spirochaetales bacterium]|nr:glycosyltransferase [Spirochaetales bacterium]
MKLTIVIPVYNEGGNIRQNLDNISAAILPIKDETEIAIVYDFEEDNTLPIVKSMMNAFPVHIRLQKNPQKGVCSAIKEGLLAAESTFVLVTMADMSDDYGKLPQMLKKAEEGYDVVCGSRYMKGGHQYGGPLLKKFISSTAGRSLHLLSGIPTHDITNSYKLYRKSIFKSITIESVGGFEIGLEITAKAYLAGYKVTEVPCSWWDRSNGESRFQLKKWLPLYLHWYLKVLPARFMKKGLK